MNLITFVIVSMLPSKTVLTCLRKAITPAEIVCALQPLTLEASGGDSKAESKTGG
jgi:hypothetical protein